MGEKTDVDLSRLNISFPFREPYASQKAVMKGVIDACATRSNALIESPTGTGKTLALLASSLAYKQVDDNLKQIVYTSRTHLQLQQVLREFKQLKDYKPKMALMGSRNEYCINKDLKANTNNIDLDCQLIQLDPKLHCPFSIPKAEIPDELQPEGSLPKFDKDEFISFCKKKKICPYYLGKLMADSADIVFSPYNYYLSAQANRWIGGNYTVGIFDEAHNIESVCREELSFEFTHGHLIALRQLLDQNNPMEFQRVVNITRLIISHFIKTMEDNNRKYKKDTDNYMVFHKTYQYIKGFRFDKTLSQIGEELSRFAEDANPKKNRRPPDQLVNFAKTVGNIFKIITTDKYDTVRFVVNFKPRIDDASIRLICLDPSVLFNFCVPTNAAVIFASGTLRPPQAYSSEFRIPFQVKVQAGHVIPPDHILVRRVNEVNGIRVTSTFKYLQNHSDAVYDALGKVLEGLVKTTDGGILFFAPSFSQASAMERRWEKTGTLANITAFKDVLIERPGDKRDVASMFRAKQGRAVLVCFCRGKISEGMDLKDSLVRIVLFFGVPYPPTREPEIAEKRKYNDAARRGFSGDEWYTAQAYRAMLQALGRIVRHDRDYGAIVLLDDRIKARAEFPQWMLGNFSEENLPISVLVKQVHDFLRKMEAELGAPMPSAPPAAKKREPRGRPVIDFNPDVGTSKSKASVEKPPAAVKKEINPAKFDNDLFLSDSDSDDGDLKKLKLPTLKRERRAAKGRDEEKVEYTSIEERRLHEVPELDSDSDLEKLFPDNDDEEKEGGKDKESAEKKEEERRAEMEKIRRFREKQQEFIRQQIAGNEPRPSAASLFSPATAAMMGGLLGIKKEAKQEVHVKKGGINVEKKPTVNAELSFGRVSPPNQVQIFRQQQAGTGSPIRSFLDSSESTSDSDILFGDDEEPHHNGNDRKEDPFSLLNSFNADDQKFNAHDQKFNADDQIIVKNEEPVTFEPQAVKSEYSYDAETKQEPAPDSVTPVSFFCHRCHSLVVTVRDITCTEFVRASFEGFTRLAGCAPDAVVMDVPPAQISESFYSSSAPEWSQEDLTAYTVDRCTCGEILGLSVFAPGPDLMRYSGHSQLLIPRLQLLHGNDFVDFA